jgi:hypothetical protein
MASAASRMGMVDRLKGILIILLLENIIEFREFATIRPAA